MRFIVVVLALGLLLGTSGGSVAAQDAACAPVEVGDATGVYFLVLGESCGAPADGYTVSAHLVRDDDATEVLVLTDVQHEDAETHEAAQILAEHLKDGSVDGVTWHDFD